jgi:hypothetical protein
MDRSLVSLVAATCGRLGGWSPAVRSQMAVLSMSGARKLPSRVPARLRRCVETLGSCVTSRCRSGATGVLSSRARWRAEETGGPAHHLALSAAGLPKAKQEIAFLKSAAAYLARHAIEQRMSRKGDCWDNAVVESVFATLAHELPTVADFARSARRIWRWPSSSRRGTMSSGGTRASATCAPRSTRSSSANPWRERHTLRVRQSGPAPTCTKTQRRGCRCISTICCRGRQALRPTLRRITRIRGRNSTKSRTAPPCVDQ